MLSTSTSATIRTCLANASDWLLLMGATAFGKDRHFDLAVAELREALGLMGFDVIEKLTPQQAAALALARRLSEDRVESLRVAADDRGDIVGTR